MCHQLCISSCFFSSRGGERSSGLRISSVLSSPAGGSLRPPLQPLRSLVVAGRCGVARNNGAGRSHLMATAASVHATCARLVVAVYCCSSCAWGARVPLARCMSGGFRRRSLSVRGVRAPRLSAANVGHRPCAVCGRHVPVLHTSFKVRARCAGATSRVRCSCLLWRPLPK